MEKNIDKSNDDYLQAFENAVEEYLAEQYHNHNEEPVHIFIGGKDMIIPYEDREKYKGNIFSSVTIDFYGLKRPEVQRAFAAYKAGEGNDENIGFIKIHNVYAPITEDMNISPADDKTTKKQVVNYYYNKNYIDRHMESYFRSYYNIPEEQTLGDKIHNAAAAGKKMAAPYIQQVKDAFNRGSKAAEEFWGADLNNMNRKEFAQQIFASIKDTMIMGTALAKDIAMGKKNLDPKTEAEIRLRIAQLNKFRHRMDKLIEKAKPIGDAAAKHFDKIYNYCADGIGSFIENTHLSAETKARLLGLAYLTGTVVPVVAAVNTINGGAKKGTSPSYGLSMPGEKQDSTPTYDATKDFADNTETEAEKTAREAAEKQAKWEEEQTTLKAKWEKQEAARIAKEQAEAKKKREEQESKRLAKEAEIIKPLAAVQPSLKVETKAPARLENIKLDPKDIPLTKDQKKMVNKAKKKQAKEENKEEKRIAANEKKLAKEQEKITKEKIEANKKSIRAEAEANRKGDFALANQIRDTRENESILIVPNHLRASLKPIYGMNPMPKDSLIKMIPYSHRMDLSDKKLENRESCYEAAINIIGKKKGYDYPYFNELVRACVAMAANESGFRDDVKASKSSATGLFQPLNATFLQAVYHDMDNYSVLMGINKAELQKHLVQKVKKAKNSKGQWYTKSISYVIENKAFKTKVLDKRKDANVGIYFGVNHMLENLESAEKKLGRSLKPSEYGRELYGRHHHGEAGCAAILKKADQPIKKGDKIAEANTWMYKCKNWGEVLDVTAAMYNKQYKIETKSWDLHQKALAKMDQAAKDAEAEKFQYENLASMLSSAEEDNNVVSVKGKFMTNPNLRLAAWNNGNSAAL